MTNTYLNYCRKRKILIKELGLKNVKKIESEIRIKLKSNNQLKAIYFLQACNQIFDITLVKLNSVYQNLTTH